MLVLNTYGGDPYYNLRAKARTGNISFRNHVNIKYTWQIQMKEFYQ